MEKAAWSTFLPVGSRGEPHPQTLLAQSSAFQDICGRERLPGDHTLEHNLLTLCTTATSLMIRRGKKQSQLMVTSSHTESSEN